MKKPFAHMFYFELADDTPDTINNFNKLCTKYLSGHQGQTHFSIGLRATRERRAVNATAFDVSVNMIFEDYPAYENYKNHERQQQFITETAGMSVGRIVYDSFLQDSDQDECKS